MARSSSSTLQQFIRFSTDAYGLERFLRLLQSITQILASYPLLTYALVGLLSTRFPFTAVFPSTPKSYMILTTPVLLTLRSRLALGRRFFRIFRFVDAFASARDTFSSSSSSSSSSSEGGRRTTGGGRSSIGAQEWLEVLAKTFNGMYLLLESVTLADDLQLGGGWDGVWGAKKAKELNREGQRFWFLSLACGCCVGVMRLWKLRMATTMTTDGNEKKAAAAAAAEKKDKKVETAKRKKDEGETEKQKQSQKKMISKSAWRLVADLMDMAGPGKAVGWIKVDDGVVGILMLGSTWLTGLEIWDRCGREVAARTAAER